jgi:uncharacterized iron-regulated membrane protein
LPAELDRLSSIEAAYVLVQRELPGRTPTSVVFPSNRVGSPHHFLVWTKGSSPLTGRLFTPVLVNAERGELAMVVDLPWHLRAIQVSRPLHIGDCGGLPLKIIRGRARPRRRRRPGKSPLPLAVASPLAERGAARRARRRGR